MRWILPAVWLLLAFAWGAAGAEGPSDLKPTSPIAKRVVLLKIDGLNGGLLERYMREIDPATGKPELPWFSRIFLEHGTVFENFYTRGVSLSAPSWSILDTGRHAIIRGNVEYDRYTGQIYDYLNFFPFYLSYARKRQMDMPGVQVLDRAGIELISDHFGFKQRFQSFQLFQRGVHWRTLARALRRRFSSRSILASIEGAGSPPLGDVLSRATEIQLERKLQNPKILYLDFFTGEIDHIGHDTNDPAALLAALKALDAKLGRVWTAIENSALANETVLAIVSDHGMNNVPGVISQTFSLADLFNSPAGGAHHVLTDRYPMSDFKLKGLNPLVHRVVTSSNASFYLSDQASQYPTAWLDIDGNERAAVQFRNSDLNKIQILLQQLAQHDLPARTRAAAAVALRNTIDRHRNRWSREAAELGIEMKALEQAIDARRALVEQLPKKWTQAQREDGEKRAALRKMDELAAWEREHNDYRAYIAHLRALLVFRPDPAHPLKEKISDLVPENSLGDPNTVYDLQHYVAGPAASGLVVDASGGLDEARSFRYVDYFPLLTSQRARNNPQPELSPRPIDFLAMRLPVNAYIPDHPGPQHAYWVYGDESNQLVILTDPSGRIAVQPVRELAQDASGKISWIPQQWRAGLPLHFFEDPEFQLPAGTNRAQWLSDWHTEREWLDATNQCLYSDAVIGLIEELAPIAPLIPGPPGISPVLLRYERQRRELAQADLHIFASNHWNFNVRFPNPGGNHGSFFRISTHSVWMLAGAGIPHQTIQRPYDGLNFANTMLSLVGRTPPLPHRVVELSIESGRGGR